MQFFVYRRLFGKRVEKILTSEQYTNLLDHLANRPDAGDIVPGSGGVRKLRWGAKGKGKRGGARIIYYWQVRDEEIWLLTIYAKNEEGNIPGHILKEIKERFEREER
jgi:mRNA-degrading endonuclease RelE of RelBE toxin-antitoxin system